MGTLVVTQQGAVIHCRKGVVVVEHEGIPVARIPEEQLEQALLLGAVGVTTRFVQIALDRRVPVTFLSQDGRYRGRLDPGGLRDARARIAQIRLLDSPVDRVPIARAIVDAKICSQRAVLLRADRNRHNPAVEAAAAAIDALCDRLPREDTLPRIMGIEGAAANAYFRAFPHILRNGFIFRGRSRRPPKDPANALLSLGYGLLTTEVIGALCGAGLDPQIGILHSSRGRMPALAEDILEMFRAPVADGLALWAINLGTLKAADFAVSHDGGVLLQKEALTRYFRFYRRRMLAPFRRRDGQLTTFRRELQSQATHIRRVILGEEPYEPFQAPTGGPDRRANLPSSVNAHTERPISGMSR